MRNFFNSRVGIIVQFLIIAILYILVATFIYPSNNGILFHVKIVLLTAFGASLLILFCICFNVVFGKKARPKWVKAISSAYLVLCILLVLAAYIFL